MSRTSTRGFTVLELAIAVAIVAIVATLAYTSLALARPRATLQSTAAELSALLKNARQNGLATGHPTVVVLLPNQPNASAGTGRFLVYEDPAFTFVTAAGTPNLGTLDPTTYAGGQGTTLLGSLELPPQVAVSLNGRSPPALPAPFDVVAASACNFCSASGDGRGAIVFDARGRARFYSGVGAESASAGATIALAGAELAGFELLVVMPATGAVKAFSRR
jgi:prepilin-type N-terminal cleavage/methylation domain-containing protein